MAQNCENNLQKTPQNAPKKGEKPRQIRKVLLMIQEKLLIYSRPVTITSLRQELEKDGHPLSRALLCSIINDIRARPVPGYTLVQTFTQHGCNKTTPAYQLKKISYVHIQQKK